MLEKLERLAAANISLLPTVEITTHFVFERDGFVALVERRGNELGSKIGSAGLLTGKGIAFLMLREGRQVFYLKGEETPASDEQIARLRSFQSDLRAALA
jgi:hypothetical protein